ncbi:MAG: hypothetical protein ACRD1B_09970 [Thermoanaerobaculia bacterium]
MPASARARILAGAFLVAALASSARGERLRLAAEGPDGACPPGGKLLGIARLGAGPPVSESEGCLFLVHLDGLSDAEIDEAVARLATLRAAAGAVLELPASDDAERFAYAVKRLSSIFRSRSSDGQVALDTLEPFDAAVMEELAPYVDALVVRPGQKASSEPSQRIWVLTALSDTTAAAGAALSAFAEFPQATLVGVVAGARPLAAADLDTLSRLQQYLTADVSRDPTPTRVTHRDGSTADVLRFFDAKKFAPLLLLPDDAAGPVSIELAGAFEKASVENLATGARRDFELKGAKTLALDVSKGPLAVVLQPMARKGGETRAAVEVGATRGLTADEIIARERAWDAGQREKTLSYVASMDTSLRFRVSSLPGSLDLTIRGPYFFERGKPPDWAWQEFFLNGVKWKGRTIPKLPILQPDKVTTLPLDIRLTEEYEYELAGETRIDDRPAYRVDFRPRSTVGDKPIYRGTAWIDRETFALLRRESIQLNLKGDTLSNVQTEYYRAVPGAAGVVLPLEIRGQQVFSTAGRTTAIERKVVMGDVAVNPADFEARLKEAYASKSQMVRDTDDGLRYLVPDPKSPEERLVENKLTRKSLLGVGGIFYQTGQDYPFPLLGLQYFNFDMLGKNKQLSVFFFGSLLFANYTDPAFLGSHFDLGADAFGVAIPFVETPYRDGEQIKAGSLKHLPEAVSINMGHPFGPYFKASLLLSAQYDNFKPNSDTAPDFVVPVDTFTFGAGLRLNWNQDGYNIAANAGAFSRAKWEPWGDPNFPAYDPDQKNYWKYSVEATKGFYFANFRKLLVRLSYFDGQNLDRFSQWDFGPFSTNSLTGFPSASVLADRAVLNNLLYGINIVNLVRFELSYDQALVTNRLAGYNNTYFSGIGLTTAFNGPWDNTRIRAEMGYPVVAHGVKGFTINAQMLKLF